MLSSSAGDTVFELLGEEPSSGGSGVTSLDFDLPPLSPASDELVGSPLVVDGADVVFGSYLVDSKSATPYTDATQVNNNNNNNEAGSL